MANRYKVEKLGFADKVIKLRGKGLNALSIANKLYKEEKVKLSREVVQHYLDYDKRTKGRAILSEKKFMDRLAKTELSILDRLSWANQKLIKALEEAEREKDRKHWRGVISEIRKFAELQAKLSGQLSDLTYINIQQANINVLNDFRSIVFDVLQTYPELRDDIEKKLIEKQKREENAHRKS